MAVLGAISYDPATRVQLSGASALAMTALDTTNLRITFTAPANGIVSVRLKGQTHGGTSGVGPGMYLGVLDGATVKGRLCPVTGVGEAAATTQNTREAIFTVTGLTPSSSYTWDAAYGVEGTGAASNLEYGGPNNTTTDDAAGAFQFEIWETANLLVGKLYDPASLVTKTTTSLLALTAFDTTNLRATFTAPASGNVLWRIQTLDQGSNTHGQIMLGILDGATVKAHTFASESAAMPTTASGFRTLEASGVITGLTPTSSYSFDAAYGVEIVSAGGGIKYGGPDNATINDAGGGFAYEIWAA
jgi:hypothetical protein